METIGGGRRVVGCREARISLTGSFHAGVLRVEADFQPAAGRRYCKKLTGPKSHSNAECSI
jgi:hypothetical protein